jgi:hypothetical protein
VIDVSLFTTKSAAIQAGKPIPEPRYRPAIYTR